MAASGLVSVDSDALKSFKQELTTAQNSAGQAKDSADREVNKILAQLQDRIRYWEQVRARCLAALRSAEDPRARAAAQRCIDEADSKIRILRDHVNRVNRDAEKFRRSTRNFVQCLYEPIGVLGELLAVLERYWKMSAASRVLLSRGVGTVDTHEVANKLDYGTLDQLKRPTGVRAIITQEMLGNGTVATQTITPPGYEPGKKFARGHLLGRQLGGSGDDERNLVTLYQNPTNTPQMLRVENQIRKVVESGESVDYQVIPLYDGENLMPVALKIKAKGTQGFSLETVIYNVGKK